MKLIDIKIFLALALWVCTLPLVVIIALPFLGLKITLYLAGLLLLADLVACWFLCTFRAPQKPAGGKLREEVRIDNDR
ncbi:MAG: hypothetical protein Q8O55_08995 [Dehalococcoidales bacterium]|nr:hypothetical protein [Dehalococcoidales bacterium]